jgi:hypothetical protein
LIEVKRYPTVRVYYSPNGVSGSIIRRIEIVRIIKMSDQDPVDSGPVPMMQKLLDNPFLLLFIGVASPSVLYLVWGIMEIVTIPAR